MIANKKCKGNGVTMGYGCSELVPVSLYNKPNRKYGLGISCGCYSNWLLTSENGKIVLQKAILKASKPRLELEKMKTERKENTSLSTLIKNVSIVCHEYIRERDKYKPCISCGEPWNDRHQAGHFYKAELFSTLKFNEFNINNQCQGCNLYNEGNESQYRVNLPGRIGLENYRELERLASIEKQINHKWDRSALNEIRNYYKQKLKEL